MKKRKEKRKISVLAIGYCAAILSAGVLTACSGARKDTSYREDNSIKSGVYGEAEAERSDEAAFAGATRKNAGSTLQPMPERIL